MEKKKIREKEKERNKAAGIFIQSIRSTKSESNEYQKKRRPSSFVIEIIREKREVEENR